MSALASSHLSGADEKRYDVSFLWEDKPRSWSVPPTANSEESRVSTCLQAHQIRSDRGSHSGQRESEESVAEKNGDRAGGEKRGKHRNRGEPSRTAELDKPEAQITAVTVSLPEESDTQEQVGHVDKGYLLSTALR